MSKFIIKGGKQLEGEVEVKGMKNAATPILAATMLTNDFCLIENLPRIKDVENMISLLESLGAKVKLPGTQSLLNSFRQLK